MSGMTVADPRDPFDEMFDQLLDHLEETHDLCVRPDRNGCLTRIAELCALAATLTGTMVANRK